MSVDSGYMVIRMALQGAREVVAQAGAAAKAIGATGAAATKSGIASVAASSKIRRLGSAMKWLALWGVKAATAAGAIATVGLFKATQAAVDLGEQINKNKEVFKSSSRDVIKWSKNTNTRLGLSQRAALEYAGTFGNMLVPMGFARDEAANMSKQLVDLSADMASFNNTTPEEALEALRAGLAGETEPLRRYGVFLNDARVAQEALGDKTATSTMGMTEQEKALGRMGLILSDTKDAQGDFMRTSDSLANQQRILGANLENLGAKIGKILIPPLTDAAKWINNLLQEAIKGKGPLADIARGATAVGNALKAAVAWVKGAVEWVKNFVNELKSGKGDIGEWGNRLRVIGNFIKGVLITAFKFLYNTVKRAVPGIKQLLQGLARVVGGVVKIIHGILTLDFAEIWDGATDIVSGAIKAIGGLIRTITAPFREVFGTLGNIVSNALKGALTWVKNAIRDVINLVRDAIAKVGQLASDAKGVLDDVTGFADPFGGGGPNITDILPFGATGGTMTRGGSIVVGERGPEIVDLPTGARITPNNRVGRVRRGGIPSRREVTPLVASEGAAGGGDTWLHAQLVLPDGRVLAETVVKASEDEAVIG